MSASGLFGYDEKNEEVICKRLQNNYNFDIVILTKGIRASCVFTQSEISIMSTSIIQAADTVGTGDLFAATFFVASHPQVRSLSQSYRLVVNISTFVSIQHGTMSILPDHYLSIVKDKE